MKENNNVRLIYERKYENARMDHDDGSHGCMREEDKKREVAMKL